MKVKELMTKKVITIDKEDSIINAAKKMKDHDIGILVIINEKRDVLGVITDRDIVIRSISRGNINATVDEVMTHDSIRINKNEEIVKALETMGDYQIKRLVVVDDDLKLVGIISLSDLALGKYTNKLVNETLYEISIPNPQTEKPLKYLEVDDFPL